MFAICPTGLLLSSLQQTVNMAKHILYSNFIVISILIKLYIYHN